MNMTRPAGIVFSEPFPEETLQHLIESVELPPDSCARVRGGEGFVELQVPLPMNVLLQMVGHRWQDQQFDKVVKLGDLVDVFGSDDVIERIDTHELSPAFPDLPFDGWWATKLLSQGYLVNTLEGVKDTVRNRLRERGEQADHPSNQFLDEVTTMAGLGVSRSDGLLVVPATLLLMAELLELPYRTEGARIVTLGPWVGLTFSGTTLYATASDSSWTIPNPTFSD